MSLELMKPQIPPLEIFSQLDLDYVQAAEAVPVSSDGYEFVHDGQAIDNAASGRGRPDFPLY
jgi:hypothetical protein